MLKMEPHEIPMENLDALTLNLEVARAPALLSNRREEVAASGLVKFMSDRPERVFFASDSAGRREMLADILMTIGKIGMENERIKDIDINPLIISGGKPIAVDALVVLQTT